MAMHLLQSKANVMAVNKVLLCACAPTNEHARVHIHAFTCTYACAQDQDTALHIAARDGKEACIAMLLNAKANPNQPSQARSGLSSMSCTNEPHPQRHSNAQNPCTHARAHIFPCIRVSIAHTHKISRQQFKVEALLHPDLFLQCPQTCC